VFLAVFSVVAVHDISALYSAAVVYNVFALDDSLAQHCKGSTQVAFSLQQ